MCLLLLVLTYGQGHDSQIVPDQFHHSALLERCGAAAQHRAATTSNSQKLVLQALIQGIGQGPPINYQAQPVHQEMSGGRG